MEDRGEGVSPALIVGRQFPIAVGLELEKPLDDGTRMTRIGRVFAGLVPGCFLMLSRIGWRVQLLRPEAGLFKSLCFLYKTAGIHRVVTSQ